MRSLTEIKGDDALDLIADLLEPATEIMGDKNVKTAYYTKNMASAVKVAIKGHKDAVKLILAVLEEQDPKTYEPSVTDIIQGAMQIFNDKALQDLFTLPDQTSEEDTSGSASESSEDGE